MSQNINIQYSNDIISSIEREQSIAKKLYLLFREELFDNITHMNELFKTQLLITISGHEAYLRHNIKYIDSYMEIFIQPTIRNNLTQFYLLRNIIYNYIDKIIYNLNKKYLSVYYQLISKYPEFKDVLPFHDSFPFKKDFQYKRDNTNSYHNNILHINFLYTDNEFQNILTIYYFNDFETYNYDTYLYKNKLLHFLNPRGILNKNKFVEYDIDEKTIEEELKSLADKKYPIDNPEKNIVKQKININNYLSIKGLFYIIMNEISSHDSENKIHDNNIKIVIEKIFNYYYGTNGNSKKIMKFDTDEKETKIILPIEKRSSSRRKLKEEDEEEKEETKIDLPSNIMSITTEQKDKIKDLLKKEFDSTFEKRIKKGITTSTTRSELIDLLIQKNQESQDYKNKLLNNRLITKDVLIYYLIQDEKYSKKVEMAMKNKRERDIVEIRKQKDQLVLKKPKISFSIDSCLLKIYNENIIMSTLITEPEYSSYFNYLYLETLFINLLGMNEMKDYFSFFSKSNGTLDFWKIFKVYDTNDCSIIELNYMFPNMIIEDYTFKKLCFSNPQLYQNYTMYRSQYLKRFIQEPFSPDILTDVYISSNIVQIKPNQYFIGNYEERVNFTENNTLFSNFNVLLKKLTECFITNLSTLNANNNYFEGTNIMMVPKYKEIKNTRKTLNLYKSQSNIFNKTLIYRLEQYNKNNENKIDGITIQLSSQDTRIYLFDNKYQPENNIISDKCIDVISDLILHYKTNHKEYLNKYQNKNISVYEIIKKDIYRDIQDKLKIDLLIVEEDVEYRFIRDCENILKDELQNLNHDYIKWDTTKFKHIIELDSDDTKKIKEKLVEYNTSLWDFCQSAISTKLRPWIYKMITDVKTILGGCIEIMVAGREAANLSVKGYERVISTDIDTKVFFRIFEEKYLKYYPSLQAAIIDRMYFEVFERLLEKITNEYYPKIYPLLLELSDTFEFKALGIEFFSPEEGKTFKRRYTIFETISSEKLFTSDINLLALEFHIKKADRMPTLLNINNSRYSNRFADMEQNYSMLDMPLVTPENVKNYESHNWVSFRTYDYYINTYSESSLNSTLYPENYFNSNKLLNLYFLNKEHEKYDKEKMIYTNMRPLKTDKDIKTLKGLESSKCTTNSNNNIKLCDYLKNINKIEQLNMTQLVQQCECNLDIDKFNKLLLNSILNINIKNTSINPIKKNIRFMFPLYNNFIDEKTIDIPEPQIQNTSVFTEFEKLKQISEIKRQVDFKELSKYYTKEIISIYSEQKKYIQELYNIMNKHNISYNENHTVEQLKEKLRFQLIERIKSNSKKNKSLESLTIKQLSAELTSLNLQEDLQEDLEMKEYTDENIIEDKLMVSKRLNFHMFKQVYLNSKQQKLIMPEYRDINALFWVKTEAQDNLRYRINLNEYTKLSMDSKEKIKFIFLEFIFHGLLLCLVNYEDMKNNSKDKYLFLEKQIKHYLSTICYGITSESVNAISISQLSLYVFMFWIPFLTKKQFIKFSKEDIFYQETEIPEFMTKINGFNDVLNKFATINDQNKYKYSGFILCRNITYILLHLIDTNMASEIIGNFKTDTIEDITKKYEEFTENITNKTYEKEQLTIADIEDEIEMEID